MPQGQFSIGANIHAMPGVFDVVKSISTQIRNVQKQATQGMRDAVSQTKGAFDAASSLKARPATTEAVDKAIASINKVAGSTRATGKMITDMHARIAQALVSMGNDAKLSADQMTSFDEIIEKLSPDLQELAKSLLTTGQTAEQNAQFTKDMERAFRAAAEAIGMTTREARGLIDAEVSGKQAEDAFTRSVKDGVAATKEKVQVGQQAARATADMAGQVARHRQQTQAGTRTTSAFVNMIRGLTGSAASATKSIGGVVKWLLMLVPNMLRSSRATDEATRSTKRFGRSQQETQKFLRTTVSQSYATVRSLDILMSAFQGIQLGSALLTGSMQGLGMSIFFMRMSFIPLTALFAVVTVAVMGLAKVIQGLKKAISELGKQAQDTLVHFRALAGGVVEGTKTWIASTDWAIRYGRSLEETRESMVSFWQQGLLNEDMMKASIALSSAWGMELSQATQILSDAVGEEEANTEALRKYGIVVDGVTDGMSRMDIAARVAESTMNRFGDSIDARLRTISGASQRAKSAIAGFWEAFMEPIATNVIAPLINSFANMISGLLQLVRGLWMSSEAQSYFNATLDKARKLTEKYRPEIEMLAAVVRLVVVTSFWMLQRALRAAVNAAERFFQWIRNITSANTALGRTLKPLTDMLRMLSTGIKEITFSGLLQKFKELMGNLGNIFGPFGDFISTLFTSLMTVWEENSGEFISNAIATFTLASIWKKFFGGKVSPLKAVFRTFLLNIFGETLIESLPVEDWVKGLLNRIFDWTVWGFAIGSIIGGLPGGLIGAAITTILGILDEQLGLGIGDAIRNAIPKTKEDWTALWDTAVVSWNKFWAWVNQTMWPGIGEIATSFAQWLNGDIDFATFFDNVRESFRKGLDNFSLETLFSGNVDGVFDGKIWELKYGWVEVRDKKSPFDIIKEWISDIGKSDTFTKISEWIENLKTKFNEAFPGMSRLIEIVKTSILGWGQAIIDFVTPLLNVFEPLGRAFVSFGTLIIGSLAKISTMIATIFPIISKIWLTLAEGAKSSGVYEIIQGLAALVGGTLSAAFQMLLIPINFVLTLLTKGFPAAWKNLKIDLANVLATLLDAANTLRERFKEGFDKFTESITNFGTTFGEKWRDIWNDIKDWFSNTWIGQAYEVITGWFQSIYDFFTGNSWDDDMLAAWKNLWTNIKDWFSNTWFGKAVTAITSWFEDIKTKFDVWKTEIQSKWEEIWNAAKTWFTDTFRLDMLEKARQWLQEMYDKVNTEITNIKDRIPEILGEAVQTLYTKGTEILAGLWSGLKSKWEEIKTWLDGIAKDIADILGLESSSPSRIMQRVGKNVADGMLLGMQNMVSGTKGIAKDITKNLQFSGQINGEMFANPAYSTTSNNINIFISGNTFGSNGDDNRFAGDLADELVTRLQLRGVNTTRRF